MEYVNNFSLVVLGFARSIVPSNRMDRPMIKKKPPNTFFSIPKAYCPQNDLYQ